VTSKPLSHPGLSTAGPFGDVNCKKLQKQIAKTKVLHHQPQSTLPHAIPLSHQCLDCWPLLRLLQIQPLRHLTVQNACKTVAFVMVRVTLRGLEANSTVEKKSRLAIAATNFTMAGIRACVTVNQGNYFLVLFVHSKLSEPCQSRCPANNADDSQDDLRSQRS
jgi:hypothetical protein